VPSPVSSIRLILIASSSLVSTVSTWSKALSALSARRRVTACARSSCPRRLSHASLRARGPQRAIGIRYLSRHGNTPPDQKFVDERAQSGWVTMFARRRSTPLRDAETVTPRIGKLTNAPHRAGSPLMASLAMLVSSRYVKQIRSAPALLADRP